MLESLSGQRVLLLRLAELLHNVLHGGLGEAALDHLGVPVNVRDDWLGNRDGLHLALELLVVHVVGDILGRRQAHRLELIRHRVLVDELRLVEADERIDVRGRLTQRLHEQAQTLFRAQVRHHAERVQVAEIELPTGESQVGRDLLNACNSSMNTAGQAWTSTRHRDKQTGERTAGDEYDAVESSWAAPNMGK